MPKMFTREEVEKIVNREFLDMRAYCVTIYGDKQVANEEWAAGELRRRILRALKEAKT